jgi:hypothetical protein
MTKCLNERYQMWLARGLMGVVVGGITLWWLLWVTGVSPY